MTRRLATILAACIVLLTAVFLVVNRVGAHQTTTADAPADQAATSAAAVEEAADLKATRTAPAHDPDCPMAADGGFGAELKGLEGVADVIVLRNITRVYGPVRFTHRLHAEMSQLKGGCANCHHGEPGVEKNFSKCETCHAKSVTASTLEQPTLKGAFHRQCLGCHRDWAHENGCGFCHEGKLGPKAASDGVGGDPLKRSKGVSLQSTMVYETTYESAPAVTFHHIDHAEKFGISCNQCHAGDSCSDCHDKKVERRAADRHADCMSCHVEKDNCSFCHDASARKPAHDAERTGWCLEPHHVDVACQKCHGPANEFVKPSTDCRSCHGSFKGQEFDHAVTGITLYGSHAHYDCARCHIGNGNGIGSAVTCDGCHPKSDISWPADLPGKRRGE